MVKAKTERKRIAIHESGHCLMHILQGGRFQIVTVHPGENFRAMVQGPSISRSDPDYPTKKIMCCLAGHCAEEIYLERPFNIFTSPQAQSDLENIRDVIKKEINSPAMIEAFFKSCLQKTQAIISNNENRERLELISEKLLDKGLLTFDEVRKLVFPIP